MLTTLRMATPQNAVFRLTILVGWSPNSAAHLPGADHFRIRGASPGLSKRREILESPIHAKLIERMRIGLGLQTRGFGPVVRGPVRGKSEQELLIGVEAVDRGRRGPARERFLVRGVGDHEAAEIRDAFAFLELAVAMQAGLDFERVEFLRDAIAALLEILQVVGGPPVFQVTVGIELRALIVEAVRHLVPDY